MTTLINQKSGSDCVLAAIAMAAGKTTWEDVWNADDLQKVIDEHGVGDIAPWMERVGMLRNVHYREIYTQSDPRLARSLLWGRRALLTIDSLNIDGGMHMVYWDGEKLWDPHFKHDDYLFHKHLGGTSVYKVFLLK